MSAVKHTPGPWAQYEHDPLVIVDAVGSSLGEMTPGDPYLGYEAAKANACLTAAAPDMLTALRLCEGVLGRLRPHHPGALTAFNAAFAAIAKAEGRTDA